MTSPKQAVCALILHPNYSDAVLGVSRKDDLTAFGLPGGKVEEGESLVAACIRETEEETGLIFTPSRLILSHLSKGEVDYVSTTYLGTLTEYPSIDWRNQKNDEGVTKWCTWRELFAGPFGAYNRILYREYYGF